MWLLPDKSKFEIVVAKYMENVSWRRQFGDNVTVYDKSPLPVEGSVALRNVGREANTYLRHIVDRYESLADRTLFVQGKCVDHSTLPLWRYYLTSEPFVSCTDEVRTFDSDHRWFCYDRWWTILSGDKHAFLGLLGDAQEPPQLQFYNYGAQFSATRELIRRRKRSHWQSLLEITERPSFKLPAVEYGNYEVAVLFEIFWPIIMLGATGAGSLSLSPKRRDILSPMTPKELWRKDA